MLAGSATATAQSDAVQVGPGQVLVGMTGGRGDILIPEVRAAAEARLGGETIGIVLLPDIDGRGALPRDFPIAQGAADAIEALGARPAFCTAVRFTRRAARCDGKGVAGLVALALYPGTNLVAPGRLIERGLPVVVIGAADTEPAFCLIDCPDPLPATEWFAGCLRVDYTDLGVAAVDVITSIVGAGRVPADLFVSPSIEVVAADGTVPPVDPSAAGEPEAPAE